MDIKKKKHTRASLNLYLVAGLYLLYIDYSLFSKWRHIETTGGKIMTGIAGLGFGVFAIGILIYSIKGLSRFQKDQEALLEQIRAEEKAAEEEEDKRP